MLDVECTRSNVLVRATLRQARGPSSSEDRCRLEKKSRALRRSLTERCGSSLISHLDRPKGRQITVNKECLDIVPLDCGIRLKEEPQKQILREELVRSQDVNPSAYQRGTAAFG